jgi:hypothetical protein
MKNPRGEMSPGVFVCCPLFLLVDLFGLMMQFHAKTSRAKPSRDRSPKNRLVPLFDPPAVAPGLNRRSFGRAVDIGNILVHVLVHVGSGLFCDLLRRPATSTVR